MDGRWMGLGYSFFLSWNTSQHPRKIHSSGCFFFFYFFFFLFLFLRRWKEVCARCNVRRGGVWSGLVWSGGLFCFAWVVVVAVAVVLCKEIYLSI